MRRHLLVAGIGDLLKSDDGFGPEVVRRLGDRVDEEVRVVDYGVHYRHLTHDLLDGYDALVLVDALPTGGSPGDLTVLRVAPEDLSGGGPEVRDGHPAAVLSSLVRQGGTIPYTYVVGCHPGSLEDAMGLTEPVAAALSAAVDTVRQLIELLLTELSCDLPFPVPVP